MAERSINIGVSDATVTCFAFDYANRSLIWNGSALVELSSLADTAAYLACGIDLSGNELVLGDATKTGIYWHTLPAGWTSRMHLEYRIGTPEILHVPAFIEDDYDPDAVTAASVADAVWDELLADHTDAGSGGAALAAAGAAGDPWTTELPGSYGSGTAGEIIGTTLLRLASEVDGVSIENLLTVALAILAGKTSYTSATRTLIVYARDGTTPVATIVLGTTPGNRSTSAILGE